MSLRSRRGPDLYLRATPFLRWSLLLVGILLALPPVSAPAQVAAVSGSTLAAIAKRPDLWPREVTLKVAQPAPDRRTPAVPVGTTVKVVGLKGPLIGIDYQGALLMVPVTQTDFLERGAAVLASGRTAPPPPATVTAPPAAGKETRLGAKLDPVFVQLDNGGQLARLPATTGGAESLANKPYLLLQLGGGRGFAGAMREMREAVNNARARSDNFALVLVPRPGETVEAAVQLARDSGFTKPIVDPREHGLVNLLWTKYGHSGPFALALVDAQGQIVSQTISMARGVDKFHTVLGSLAQIATAPGAAQNRPAAGGGSEPPLTPRDQPADTMDQAAAAGAEVTPAAPTTAYAAARTAFRKGRFAELDTLAERVTRERSLSRTARAELEDLLAAVEAEEPRRPDVWPAYLESIDQWLAACPGSPTAHVAKAKAWISYAWQARGHGYADTVTAEGWQLFHERVARARTVLEASKGDGATRCPHWYAAMLTVARAQNWKLEDTLAVAREGIAAAPWYHPTYHAVITHLLPRWHGRPGDWQTFAHRAADQAGPREGPYLYACLTGRAQASGEELFLTPFPVDWPLLRTGYQQLVQRYPDPQLWRQFCQLACLGGDRPAAREAFAHASFSVSFHPWDNEGEVAAWKAWAEGGAVPAQRAQQEKAFELWKAARREREQSPDPYAT